MKKRLTDRKRVSFSSDRKTGAVVLVVGKDGALALSEFDWFWACLKRCLANGPTDLCQIHSWWSVIWANSGFWKAATSKANIAILRMDQMDKKMWTPPKKLAGSNQNNKCWGWVRECFLMLFEGSLPCQVTDATSFGCVISTVPRDRPFFWFDQSPHLCCRGHPATRGRERYGNWGSGCSLPT